MILVPAREHIKFFIDNPWSDWRIVSGWTDLWAIQSVSTSPQFLARIQLRDDHPPIDS